jgi:hypothetical protein
MTNIASAVLMAALVWLPACEDDPTSPAGGTPSAFQPLTSRSAVLNNLEIGWTQRRADKIDELLDENFVFYFSPGDVGGEIPPTWDREIDLAATTALLESNQNNTIGPVCRSVRVDLITDDIVWVPVPTSPPANETRYAATVPYVFTFEVEPDITYIPPNSARAQLTVREVAVDGGTTEWRLVEWRDLDGVASMVQETSADIKTWGAIKAIYRGSRPLTRVAILNALEKAYNQRDPNSIDEILDDHFTFFFAPGDVGGNVPEQWGRVDEYDVTLRLFNSNHQDDPPSFPVATSIEVDLVFNNNIQWVEIVPEDFPDEIWYVATVFYDFVIAFDPDITYISPSGAKSQFIVRAITLGNRTEWRLVEWRDLGGNTVARSTTSVAETTWGSIKALYLD